QRLDVQVGLGQQPLEPVVLSLKLLQPLGVLSLHAAVLGPPGVEAGRAEAVLAAQFGDCHPRLGLFDGPSDLLGGETTLLHIRPRGLTDFTASRGTAQWGQVRPTAAFLYRHRVQLAVQFGGLLYYGPYGSGRWIPTTPAITIDRVEV